jgi:hypothetical protein
MRLKLVLLTSLVGAVIGAGASIAIIVGAFGAWRIDDPALSAHGWTAIVIYVIPLVTAFAAGFFVYRHTARRRKLQAVLTAVLVLLLSWTTFVALTLGFIKI